MLDHYCDDICYTCNVEPAAAQPVRINGRAAMREFLTKVQGVAQSMSVVEAFQFDGSVARATVACFVKHNGTGIVLSGYYRQVLRFRSGQISHLEEFHDAARLEAFWRLVELCEKEISDSEQKA